MNLKLKAGVRPDDPVKGLDVSVLQEKFLAPVLGIGDPRTDKRIDFVGGIRGVKELERRCEADMKIAFSMYPTSMGRTAVCCGRGASDAAEIDLV